MVNDVTHKRGGILDVVIARDENVSTVEIADQPGYISDHKLLSWRFRVGEAEPSLYKPHSRRKWKTFDIEAFKSDLRSSSLGDALGQDDVMTCPAEIVDTVITSLLDRHAPLVEVTCRQRGSSDRWYDAECRSTRRKVRRLERMYTTKNIAPTTPTRNGSMLCVVFIGWST